MTMSEKKPSSFLSSSSLMMKSVPVILIVAAAILFAAAPIPQLATATTTPGGGGEQQLPPPSEEQPPVTPTTITPSGITASLSPLTYDGGPCYGMNFTGTITDNVGNRDVTYRFIRSDGAIGPEQVIHFNQPGSSQNVIHSWVITKEPSGIVGVSYQGWAAIEILQPIQLQSNQAQFELRCTATNSTADVQPGVVELEPRSNLGLGPPGQTPIEEEESTEIPSSPPAADDDELEAPPSTETSEDGVGGGAGGDDQPAQLEGRGNFLGGGSDDDDQPAQLEGRGNLLGGGSDDDDDEIKLN